MKMFEFKINKKIYFPILSLIFLWLAWLPALWGKENQYILAISAILFWLSIFVLIFHFSKNKKFTYFIWAYFLTSIIMYILRFVLDVNTPSIVGIFFFILPKESL